MSSRKVVQTPNVRRGAPLNGRRPQQVRGFWEWLLGEVYG